LFAVLLWLGFFFGLTFVFKLLFMDLICFSTLIATKFIYYLLRGCWSSLSLKWSAMRRWTCRCGRWCDTRSRPRLTSVYKRKSSGASFIFECSFLKKPIIQCQYVYFSFISCLSCMYFWD
jgi:hypothetical protein